MTPEQYEKAIANLGLSQVGAARFLDIGERTSRRFVAHESVIPRQTEMLLNIMVKHGITPELALMKFTQNGKGPKGKGPPPPRKKR